MMVSFTPFKALLFLSAVASANYADNAVEALDTLQKWYNDDSGVWDTTGWWNSANCLTVLGDLAALVPEVNDLVTTVLDHTFTRAKAPDWDAKLVKKDRTARSSSECNQKRAADPDNFLNDYYDDEGWWALAWIQAYDITNNGDYLSTADHIFNDMSRGNSTPCGGIWWDKHKTSVNAISNELYLSVAAHLANRASDKQQYLDIAKDHWVWFRETGMINSDNLINDGLDDDTCENNDATVWTYNQGVILGALVELNKASPNEEYITTAKKIATAAIEALSNSDGVLVEPCEPDCEEDGPQFKGIFMRNLRKLQEAAPEDDFLEFINANADSIWDNDRNSENELGLHWAGPFLSPATAATHSSAMDAIVAAVAFDG